MRKIVFAVVTTAAVIVACSGPSTSEHAGTPCTTPAMCYPTFNDASAIKGTITCLTKYPGGYCTHTCMTDADCCAVPGECKTGFVQVCSPLENQPEKYCFLGCESADIAAAPNQGTTDPNAYCARFFASGSSCSSTGGGTLNRKICK